MPKWDAPLDEWIKFYSPENFKSVGVEREVPVHKFLCELRDLRALYADKEVYMWVKEHPGFFNPQNGGEPPSTEFLDEYQPGAFPLYKHPEPPPMGPGVTDA